MRGGVAGKKDTGKTSHQDTQMLIEKNLDFIVSMVLSRRTF